MRTRVLPAGPAAAERAARLLRRGELVAFPTETVYGLGARAFDPAAARRIYRAKGRPADNPLIVHVSGLSQLRAVAAPLTPLARRLARAFWPGPLTLVLEKAPGLPLAVTSGLPTVAVRCPSHPAARAILRRLGEPVAAPSANRSGRPSAARARDVLADLGGRIPLIVDGGPCPLGLESAIVDARGDRPVLLRPGTLSAARLERAAGARLARPGRGAPAAPGTRHRHYAPAAPVFLLAPGRVAAGRLPARASRSALVHRSRWGGPPPAFRRRLRGGAGAYARGLFSALRDAEASGAEAIFVEAVAERGAGKAVMDRLRRAARASH